MALHEQSLTLVEKIKAAKQQQGKTIQQLADETAHAVSSSEIQRHIEVLLQNIRRWPPSTYRITKIPTVESSSTRRDFVNKSSINRHAESEFQIFRELVTVLSAQFVFYLQLFNRSCDSGLGHTKLVALFCLAPSGGSGADDLFLQRRENRQRAELIQNYPIPRDFIHLSHQSSLGEL